MLVFTLSFGKARVDIPAVKMSEPPRERITPSEYRLPINPPVREMEGEAGSDMGQNVLNGGEGAQADTLVRDFQGFQYTYWYPPDPQIAAGNDHVVVAVNGGFRIFLKDGTLLYDNTLTGFFSPLYPDSGSVFDPKVTYDPLVDRWYVLAVYVSYSPERSFYYLAVSQTSDPMGGWYYYKLDATLDGSTPTSHLADYPDLGFNDRWIVLTSNQFTFSWNYRYGKVRFLRKSEALTGNITGWVDFWGSDLDTYTYTIRPIRSMEFVERFYLVKRRGSYLTVWVVDGPDTAPTLYPPTYLPSSFSSSTDSVPQRGTSVKLESGDFFGILGATYLGGKIYFTFGETHPLDPVYSSSRLIIVDTTFSLVENVRLYEPNESWIYPYVGVSPKGLAVVFTRVSPGRYPSVYYVSRSAWDTAFSSPRPLKEGLTWYVKVYNSRNRWGDYFGAAMDPVDSSVWIVGEYSQDTNRWSVWVGNVRFNRTTAVLEYTDTVVGKPFLYDVAGRRVSPEVVSRRKGIYFYRKDGAVRKIIVF